MMPFCFGIVDGINRNIKSKIYIVLLQLILFMYIHFIKKSTSKIPLQVLKYKLIKKNIMKLINQ